jgi:hypothetical protein
MTKFNYVVTDIEALAAAYPQAVVTIKAPNRRELRKLVDASSTLGVAIPGVSVVEAALEPELVRNEA